MKRPFFTGCFRITHRLFISRSRYRLSIAAPPRTKTDAIHMVNFSHTKFESFAETLVDRISLMLHEVILGISNYHSKMQGLEFLMILLRKLDHSSVHTSSLAIALFAIRLLCGATEQIMLSMHTTTASSSSREHFMRAERVREGLSSDSWQQRASKTRFYKWRPTTGGNPCVDDKHCGKIAAFWLNKIPHRSSSR